MIDTSEMMTIIADALIQSLGGPSKEMVLSTRKAVRDNFPDWRSRLGFCLCLMDECVNESDGRTSRKEICNLWLENNEEGER